MNDQITTIKNEIGKPRSDRGAKTRDAAIKFEEHFRDKEFSSDEFNEWLQTEPSLNGYSSSKARHALSKSGSREDMPKSFQIIRTRKQGWIVQPIEKLIFSDQIPETMKKHFKKCRTKMIHAFQATDWNGQDYPHQVAASLWLKTYNSIESNALSSFSTMQEMVAMLEDGNLFGLVKNPEK
jgi:hypothetical protein